MNGVQTGFKPKKNPEDKMCDFLKGGAEGGGKTPTFRKWGGNFPHI